MLGPFAAGPEPTSSKSRTSCPAWRVSASYFNPDGAHVTMRLSKRTSFKSPESPPSLPSTLQRKLSVVTFSAQSNSGS
eukprot:8046988-Alexandrium_andersonii.AAC.1